MTDPTHQALIDGYRDGLRDEPNFGNQPWGLLPVYAFALAAGQIDGGHGPVTRSQLDAAISSFREQEEKERRAVNLLKG